MPSSLQANLTLYPWYRASADAMAWMPVFFLYFSERVSLQQVLWLEAIYYATVVVVEVPSGYLADRAGRRVALTLSALALTASYCAFLVSTTFALLATAQLLLAIGISMRSGADTALHYDSLLALGRETEFAGREARAERTGLTAMAIGALAGGLVGVIDLRLPYAISIVGALVSVVLVRRMIEPDAPGWARSEDSFARQLGRCLGYLRLGAVLWLLGFYVALDTLMHVPYEFYQPYLRLLESSVLGDGSAPFMSGVLLALSMGISAWFAGHSVWIQGRLGLVPLLLLALSLQLLIVVVMSQWLSVLAAAVILLRNTPMGMTHAPFNAALGRFIATEHRATFLSLLSLCGRIALSTLLAGLALAVPADAQPDWSALQQLLGVCALLGIGAFAALALCVGRLYERRSKPPA